MQNNKRHRQGILVSCEIPWDEHERLLERSFREEVRYLLSVGFRNLYIFGTAGEGHAVDTARFERIVQIFYEETRGPDVGAMIGIIGLSTPAVLERLKFARRIGFELFQISLPSWGALNDTELLRFFVDVCGSVPDARFLHYNLSRVKRVLTPGDYRRIVDVIPNLVATKNTSTSIADTIELMRSIPELQHFFGESTFPIGCMVGECSLLSSFGAFAPKRTREFFDLGRAGRIEQLFRMQSEYLAMAADIQAPTRGCELTDGAYDKMWKRLAGLEMPLRLLSPYESFSEAVYEDCRRILYEEHHRWAEGNGFCAR